MGNNGLDAVLGQFAGFGLTWLVQSSVLLAFGLVAGRVLRRSGPAVQSGVYRTTLLAVVVCPFASAVLAAAGCDGLSLRLPSKAHESAPADRAARDEPQSIGAPSVTPSVLMPGSGQTSETPPIIAEQTSLKAAEARPAAGLGRITLRMDTTAIAAFCVAVWILGSTFMAVWLCVGWVRMRRLRSSAAPWPNRPRNALSRYRAPVEGRFTIGLAQPVPFQPVPGRTEAPGNLVARRRGK